MALLPCNGQLKQGAVLGELLWFLKPPVPRALNSLVCVGIASLPGSRGRGLGTRLVQGVQCPAQCSSLIYTHQCANDIQMAVIEEQHMCIRL